MNNNKTKISVKSFSLLDQLFASDRAKPLESTSSAELSQLTKVRHWITHHGYDFLSNDEASALYNQYRAMKEEGHSESYTLVMLGLKDPIGE